VDQSRGDLRASRSADLVALRSFRELAAGRYVVAVREALGPGELAGREHPHADVPDDQAGSDLDQDTSGSCQTP